MVTLSSELRSTIQQDDLSVPHLSWWNRDWKYALRSGVISTVQHEDLSVLRLLRWNHDRMYVLSTRVVLAITTGGLSILRLPPQGHDRRYALSARERHFLYNKFTSQRYVRCDWLRDGAYMQKLVVMSHAGKYESLRHNNLDPEDSTEWLSIKISRCRLEIYTCFRLFSELGLVKCQTHLISSTSGDCFISAEIHQQRTRYSYIIPTQVTDWAEERGIPAKVILLLKSLKPTYHQSQHTHFYALKRSQSWD